MDGGEGAPAVSPVPVSHSFAPSDPDPPVSRHLAVSVIIPVLNEMAVLPDLLRNLQDLHDMGELLFVDGGSSDATVEWLRGRGHVVLQAARGRGTQMAVGATAATGDIFWFLHADSLVLPQAISAIQCAVASGSAAGACRLQFSGRSLSARWMTWFYARLRSIGLIYGDAGIFVTREAYARAGGFPPYPLFEDLGLLRRLRSTGFRHLACIEVPLTTSSRRFQGWRFPFVFLQWVALQSLFWLGTPPELLAQLYGRPRGGI